MNQLQVINGGGLEQATSIAELVGKDAIFGIQAEINQRPLGPAPFPVDFITTAERPVSRRSNPRVGHLAVAVVSDVQFTPQDDRGCLGAMTMKVTVGKWLPASEQFYVSRVTNGQH